MQTRNRKRTASLMAILPFYPVGQLFYDWDLSWLVSAKMSFYMKACKENNATPVILLALLMSRGIAALYPEYNKPINANIATDMRSALDAPNTFKNCVKTMLLPYSREFSQKSLPEQATEYRELLKAQRDRDYCRKEANAMIGLSNKLDSLESYEEKQDYL